MVRYHTHQCRRAGVVLEDGNYFCKQHAPSAEKARREKSYAEYEAKKAAARAERTRQAVAIKFHDKLVALVSELAGDDDFWDVHGSSMHDVSAMQQFIMARARALLE